MMKIKNGMNRKINIPHFHERITLFKMCPDIHAFMRHLFEQLKPAENFYYMNT